MKVFRKNQFKPKQWSGGLTTELFIYPFGAAYGDRNFDFRLSTATVEIETSTFTELPNITRTLMVLEGKMTLLHHGHHQSTLHPLQSDSFQGDWNTTSIGKCVDFNLMCSPGYSGVLNGFTLDLSASFDIPLNSKFNFLYLNNGKAIVDKLILNSGDLLQFDQETDVQVKAISKAQCVLITVNKNPLL